MLTLFRAPALMLLAAAPGVAQQPASPGESGETRVAWPAPPPLETILAAPSLPALTSPPAAAAASLLVPGAGQAALGQRRWVVYALAEAAFWTVRLESLSDRRTAARAYRDLAWEAARMADAPRIDGSWGYYETMGQYLRSGAFDRDPVQDGVQPEDDPATYNGAVWNISRALYLPDGEGAPGTPGYEQALEHYSSRAAGDAFLWSWEGSEDAWTRFGALIDDADDASRLATAALGAVLANHFVSAVDALLTARLRTESRYRLESRIAAARPLRWSVGLHVPIKDRK